MKSPWHPGRMQALDAYEERLTFFKSLPNERLYKWQLTAYVWKIIVMRNVVLQSEDQALAETYAPVLMKRLKKVIKRYRNDLPIAENCGIYEYAYPWLMKWYWVAKSQLNKFKRT